MANTPHRPLSPHLMQWRWHATMASSIFHRATGVANYVGAVLIAVWLVLTASGPEAYGIWETMTTGAMGVLVSIALIGFTFSVSYHLLNGIRHLAWDIGLGFDPEGSNVRSVLIFAVAILVTAVIWIIGGLA